MILMWEDNKGSTFSLEEALLWTCILTRKGCLKLKCLISGFVSYNYAVILCQNMIVDGLQLC